MKHFVANIGNSFLTTNPKVSMGTQTRDTQSPLYEMKMYERAFRNPYQDYDEDIKVFDFENDRLISEIEAPLLENVFILLETLEKHLATDVDWSDSTVYTGTSGIALLYMRFLEVKVASAAKEDKDFLQSALNYVLPVIPVLKHKRFSFICGASGPLAIAATLFHKKGMEKEADDLARRCENLGETVCNAEMPDDHLYGRAGYLYSLLYLEKQIGPDEFRQKTIKQVIDSLISWGKYNAKRFENTKKVPLYYWWNERVYLGAAHGMSGILYMLMQAREYLAPEQLQELVRPSIDYVLDLQWATTGNWSTSLNHPVLGDKLLHWCHGGPGIIHCMLLAYQVFEDDVEKYLQAAVRCSDRIWERGLLHKGYGICHGAAGNGYAHLRIFQVTKDVKYLYRAVKFAEWCFDYGKHGCRTPDRPLSLFEGFAGTIYYLLDLLDPLHSAFPAFQLF